MILRVWVWYGPGQVEQSDPKVVVSYTKIYENFANYFKNEAKIK